MFANEDAAKRTLVKSLAEKAASWPAWKAMVTVRFASFAALAVSFRSLPYAAASGNPARAIAMSKFMRQCLEETDLFARYVVGDSSCGNKETVLNSSRSTGVPKIYFSFPKKFSSQSKSTPSKPIFLPMMGTARH